MDGKKWPFGLVVGALLTAQWAWAQYVPLEIAGPGGAVEGNYSGLTQPTINAQGEVAFTGFLSIPGSGTAYAVFRDDGLPGSPAVPLYLNVAPSAASCTALIADPGARDDRCINYGIGTYAVVSDTSAVAFDTVSPAGFTVTDIVSGDGGAPPRVLLQEATSFTFPTFSNEELLRGDFLASGVAAAWFNQDSACQGVSLGLGDGSQLTNPQIGVPTTDATPFDEVLDSCNPPPLAGSSGTWDPNLFFPTLSAALSPDGAWAAFNAEGRLFDGTARLIDGIFLASTGGTRTLELLYEGDVFLAENTPAVNASGSVAFLELNGLDYALRVVERSNPGVATTIAEIIDITSTNHRFRAWAINAAGTVAFTRDVTGGQGLFVYDPGSGAVTPVIQAGDAYDGGTVSALSFSKRGLNDAGELVVRARVVFPGTTAQDYVLKFASATDGDGDGVPDATDVCPAEAGMAPSGCLPHGSDYAPADWVVNLSELLRTIQFYNTGEYSCDPQGEDGYAPGAGDRTCAPHASDYNPQDWTINLSELLRVIQFYNSGGYHPDPTTEDGFAPGP